MSLPPLPALLVACLHGRVDLIPMLLQMGADPEVIIQVSPESKMKKRKQRREELNHDFLFLLEE